MTGGGASATASRVPSKKQQPQPGCKPTARGWTEVVQQHPEVVQQEVEGVKCLNEWEIESTGFIESADFDMGLTQW
eukprot:CAMPEP_0197843468 /NCGR_PEP_ID=MMETSP1438-20131217/355_1 /TAXON_ID=1461541 /ORGANISM="Pterosperma sp., Strain CCMP1384" /LENGTH=75 /DNA_ID=CAMNT_0043453643 /DNA_START=104 /DNA_END=328 /DNA_ORIENTATION=-